MALGTYGIRRRENLAIVLTVDTTRAHASAIVLALDIVPAPGPGVKIMELLATSSDTPITCLSSSLTT